MAIIEIAPGICGFDTRVVATANEDLVVALEITSDCAHIQQLAGELTRLSALAELGHPITETATYRAASRSGTHPSCPVPAGVLKAVEVAAGLALPADVHIRIRKD